MDVLLLVVVFVLGVGSGIAIAPKVRRLASGASTGRRQVTHKDLSTFAHVWYPRGGEWQSGRVSGPSESSRNYYNIWPTARGDKVRVALLDLRLDTGEPLGEMCPPLSIVEMEAEMR